MDYREAFAIIMFSKPRYITNSFSVIFPRQQEIRRKANALEDKLQNDYSQPQIFPIPDDMDPEVPRIIFGSRHGFSQIVMSQVSFSLNVTYSPDWQVDIEKGKDYLLKRSSLLYDLLEIAGIRKFLFSGLVTQVNLSSEESDSVLLHHLANSLLKEDNASEVHDIEVKKTHIVDEKFFSNIVISNYRSWNLESIQTGVLSLSRNKSTEKGIRILCDFNDRFAFNETRNYRSERSLIDTIITKGLEIAKNTANELMVIN